MCLTPKNENPKKGPFFQKFMEITWASCLKRVIGNRVKKIDDNKMSKRVVGNRVKKIDDNLEGFEKGPTKIIINQMIPKF